MATKRPKQDSAAATVQVLRAPEQTLDELFHDKLEESGLVPHAKQLGLTALSPAEVVNFATYFRKQAALRIPYFDENGQQTSFYRVRYLGDLPHGFIRNAAKEPPKYQQLAGTLNEVYLAPVLPEGQSWAVIFRDPTVPLTVTEGELKAASATANGLPTLGLGGVDMWQAKKQGVPFLPQLEAVDWKGRDVVIAFDSDAVTKPDVRRAERRLAKELTKRGASVRIARLPPRPDNGKKQGLDDFLVAYGVGELRAVLDAAQAATFDYEHNESGNAERFVERYGGVARFVHHPNNKRARWRIWDDTHWALDDVRRVEQLAKANARSIVDDDDEPMDDGDEKAKQRLREFARRSADYKPMMQMLKCAESDPAISAHYRDFDRQPHLINCKNGTFDLHTGQFRDHDPADLITQVLNANYNAEAKAPRFLEFLEKAIPDAEVREFFQRAVGYMLTGYTTEKMLFFLLGPKNSGKTTLVEILRALLGNYSRNMESDLLLARMNDKHPEEIASLWGVRVVTIAEVPSAEGGSPRSWDQERVKLLTGGDTLSGRLMYDDRSEDQPSHKLLVHGNALPRVRNTDDEAFWVRIPIIRLPNSMPESEQDKTLKDTVIRDELDGLLAWAIAGALEYWRCKGLNPPETVKKATNDAREAQDPVGQFIDDRCELDPKANTPSAQLHHAFVEWCKANDEKCINSVHFSRRLVKRLGVESSVRVGKVRCIPGIKLLNS